MFDPITMKGHAKDSKTPILFGNERQQNLLIGMFVKGAVRRPHHCDLRELLKTGLIRRATLDRKVHYALESRHPAFATLVRVFEDLTGEKMGVPSNIPFAPQTPVHPETPLGHHCYLPFYILVRIARDGALDPITLARRIPWSRNNPVRERLERLVADGVLTEKGGLYDFAPAVPTSFADLVRELRDHLAPSNPQLALDLKASGRRIRSFQKAHDGAPLLFGPDIRLRGLMALAKYGPMHLTELRVLVGVSSQRKEGRANAPFGRGGLAREWDTDNGTAAGLDLDHPLAPQAKRLLLELEKAYPLIPLVRKCPEPEMPARRPWVGDRLSLFGDQIATSIFASIGALGWTFEKICCDVATGCARENVKTTLRRIEEEGVLTASRPRGPGFCVCVLTISEKTVAAAELTALVRAFIEVWPDFKVKVEEKMASLDPRTKEHLRRRGLVPCECHPNGGHRKSASYAYMEARRSAAEAHRRERDAK